MEGRQVLGQKRSEGWLSRHGHPPRAAGGLALAAAELAACGRGRRGRSLGDIELEGSARLRGHAAAACSGVVPAAAVLTAYTAVRMLSCRPDAVAEPFVAPRSLPAGEVVFEFHDPASVRRRPMRVFAYFPEAVPTMEPTNVLFVLHGVNRNAEDCFRRIVPADGSNAAPEEHNFVLLVPEFSTELFPGRSAYNWGNVFQVRRLPSVHAQEEDAAFSCLSLLRLLSTHICPGFLVPVSFLPSHCARPSI